MLEKEIELGTGATKRVYAQRARALTEHELRGRLRAAGLTIVGTGETSTAPRSTAGARRA